MTKYFIRKEQKDFHIIEKVTDQVIAIASTWDEANRRARRLNRGAGFDGETPPFFVAMPLKIGYIGA